jgi:hypothetical protein
MQEFTAWKILYNVIKEALQGNVYCLLGNLLGKGTECMTVYRGH